MVDTGGVFRNVTEIFWKDVKVKRVIGGKLFDGDKVYLVQQNSDIVEWKITFLASSKSKHGTML